MLKKFFLQNPLFVGLMAVYSLAALPLLLLVPKGQEVIWVNQWHSPAPDLFFKYATHLGDGLFCVLLALLLLWAGRRRDALAMMLTLALSGLLAQSLKRLLALPRPASYLAHVQLHFVEGVPMATTHSFPSGHSTTAFASFFLLALIWRGPWWGAACFGLALLAAFSRIYLAQHFFIDTFAGAWLGVLSAAPAYRFTPKRLGRYELLQ